MMLLIQLFVSLEQIKEDNVRFVIFEEYIPQFTHARPI